MNLLMCIVSMHVVQLLFNLPASSVHLRVGMPDYHFERHICATRKIRHGNPLRGICGHQSKEILNQALLVLYKVTYPKVAGCGTRIAQTVPSFNFCSIDYQAEELSKECQTIVILDYPLCREDVDRAN